ncbi:MAG: carbohydrate-binding domain-containing protein [Bacteroidaceae bacterium]|nr:carbohydrate-binding domain-containing protein [Bacteroidaceae bacterium]
MKKSTIGLVLLLLNCGACSPDSLINNLDIEPQNEAGSSDTTTVSPKIDETVLAGDSISGTNFDRTIRIVFADEGAQVTGDVNNTVSVNGNHVTVNNTTDEKVIYELTGSAQDGSLKLYSSRKQALVLNGVSLTNTTGAAINNQGKKKCFIVVKGTNSLKDGESYTSTPADEDEKAALFSEGQLIFSGDGTLTVTAQGKSGITSDDYVHFMESAVINVNSSAGHGIRGKDAVYISDGTINVQVSADMKKGITSDSLVCINGGETSIIISGSAAYDDEDAEYKGSAGIKADCLFLMNAGTMSVVNFGTGGKGVSGDQTACFNGGSLTVTTSGSNYGSSSGNRWGSSSSNSVSAKGIKFDGNLFFNGGTVTVNCAAHEGIEAKGTITVKDGIVYSYSAADDAINSGSTFTIEGGHVCGYAVRNDGLDANGNFYIKGGTVYAIGTSSPELAIDANTEGGYKLYVSGGTIIAVGGLESGASLTQSCYQASSWSKSTWYSLTVGSSVIAFKTPASGGTPLVVSGASTPTLNSGVTATGGTSYYDGMMIIDGSVSGGSSVSLSSYTGGNGGGGFGPGGGGGGHHPF